MCEHAEDLDTYTTASQNNKPGGAGRLTTIEPVAQERNSLDDNSTCWKIILMHIGVTKCLLLLFWLLLVCLCSNLAMDNQLLRNSLSHSPLQYVAVSGRSPVVILTVS